MSPRTGGQELLTLPEASRLNNPKESELQKAQPQTPLLGSRESNWTTKGHLMVKITKDYQGNHDKLQLQTPDTLSY